MKTIWEYVKENKLGSFTLALSLTYIFIGLPSQVYTIWETASARDISLPMFLLLALQSLFWVLYGSQRKDWPMIIANTFVVLFAGIITVQCLLFS